MNKHLKLFLDMIIVLRFNQFSYAQPLLLERGSKRIFRDVFDDPLQEFLEALQVLNVVLFQLFLRDRVNQKFQNVIFKLHGDH